MQNSAKSGLGMTLNMEKRLFGLVKLFEYYFNTISLVKDTKVIRNLDFHKAHK